jgi:hypothetical protein
MKLKTVSAAISTLTLGVITDEISEDLDMPLAVARELGVQHVELRAVWKKNLMDLKEREIPLRTQTPRNPN